MLAFVASGILGQYDPFGAAGEGCLLLVYPNVIAVERQLRVEPSDFRLWVCLHEVTHRVQFTANPWLSGYMSQALNLLTFEPVDDIGRVVSRLADFIRSRGHGTDDSEVNPSGILGLVRAVQSEPQRKALDQLLVLGTLLEGHAEHVMDAVGPIKTMQPAKTFAIVEARYPAIRSDSDLHTFSYEFKPWQHEKATASADAIMVHRGRSLAGGDRTLRHRRTRHHELRMVIIGSGATAVTLVPAMAQTAGAVTMPK